jgi:hypothetical protein
VSLIEWPERTSNILHIYKYTNIFCIWIFSNTCRENSSFIKIWPEYRYGTLHEGLFKLTVISRWVLLRMRNISDKVVEKIKTHIFLLCNPPPRKTYRVWDNVKKYCRDRQATDENMAHSQGMLDSQGYRHIIVIFNTSCFSMATFVTWRRLNITS